MIHDSLVSNLQIEDVARVNHPKKTICCRRSCFCCLIGILASKLTWKIDQFCLWNHPREHQTCPKLNMCFDNFNHGHIAPKTNLVKGSGDPKNVTRTRMPPEDFLAHFSRVLCRNILGKDLGLCTLRRNDHQSSHRPEQVTCSRRLHQVARYSTCFAWNFIAKIIGIWSPLPSFVCFNPEDYDTCAQSVWQALPTFAWRFGGSDDFHREMSDKSPLSFPTRSPIENLPLPQICWWCQLFFSA